MPDTDTLSFLRRMKAVGGLTPREGYAPLSAGALRRAIRATDAKFGGRITWHIVYGALNAPEASRSSPSTMPCIGAGQLLVGDAIRRHEIDGRPERPDVEAVREIPVAQGSALGRLVGACRTSRRRRGSSRSGAAASRRAAPQARPSCPDDAALIRAIRSSVFSSSNSASEASATAQASGLAVKEWPCGSARLEAFARETPRKSAPAPPSPPSACSPR